MPGCVPARIMRDLQLGALAADHGIVLTPVELESFTRAEGQRNKSAASRCLLFSLPLCTPFTGEGSNPVVGAGKPQCDQIGMELRQGAALLARLRGLGLQPACQLVGKRVELAGPLRHRELRLDRARLQILPDGVARQPGPTRDLADRQLLSQGHAADDVQKSHVDHSDAPRRSPRSEEGSHGSNLSGNQAPSRVSSKWKSTVR